jgi:hypothetical protein
MSDHPTEAASLDEIASILREIKPRFEAAHRLSVELHRHQMRAMAREANRLLRELLRDPRYGDPRRLEHFGCQVFSDGGEDGMIQEIFRRIGTTNKKFLEFGVGNGSQCNTHFLLYLGWSGLWIEAGTALAAGIRRIFVKAFELGVLTLLNDRVTPSNINALIASGGLNGEIDLLSVDIDSQDYHVCRVINAVNPRVIVIEVNPTFPPPHEWVVPLEPDGANKGHFFGASVTSMSKMMSAKGYMLVGTEITGVNAFYVRNDLVGDQFAMAGDSKGLYNPPRRGLGHMGYPQGFEAPKFWSPPAQPL